MRSRLPIALLVAWALLPALSPALARAATAGCGSQAAAINEYCEAVPGAGGPTNAAGGRGSGSSSSGHASLSATVPPSIRAAASHKAPTRALLRLPAPYRRTPATRSATGTGATSILTPLILVLAGIAAGMAVLRFTRRRREARAGA